MKVPAFLWALVTVFLTIEGRLLEDGGVSPRAGVWVLRCVKEVSLTAGAVGSPGRRKHSFQRRWKDLLLMVKLPVCEILRKNRMLRACTEQDQDGYWDGVVRQCWVGRDSVANKLKLDGKKYYPWAVPTDGHCTRQNQGDWNRRACQLPLKRELEHVPTPLSSCNSWQEQNRQSPRLNHRGKLGRLGFIQSTGLSFKWMVLKD